MALRLTAALQGMGQQGEVHGLRRLSGGANMETWSFDWQSGEAKEPLILRRLPSGGTSDEGDAHKLDIETEAKVIGAAVKHGVAAPKVRLVLNETNDLGKGFVMSRERGEALPNRLLVDAQYAAAREKLAFQCGAELGKIQQVPLDALPAGLPDNSGDAMLKRLRAMIDQYGAASPVHEVAFKWLQDNAPASTQKVLVHGDFRMGNILVDEQGLVAVLDWEMAYIGHPAADIGLMCANVWRFGSPLPVGGFGVYEDLLSGYESVTGTRPTMEEIRYWQVVTTLGWGLVCLMMQDMYRSGKDRSLERAAIGRRVSESEIDLMLMMEGNL